MERFLPTLVSIFQAPPEKTPLGINAVSISVVINASDKKKAEMGLWWAKLEETKIDYISYPRNVGTNHFSFFMRPCKFSWRS